MLTKDSKGQARKFQWSYQTVVGMLNYLCIMQPEILFAVHQCTHFSIDPWLSHKIAVKRLVCYLKHTQNEGLILTLIMSARISCYINADFASAWDQEDSTDPCSIYSCTGYVIMYANLMGEQATD